MRKLFPFLLTSTIFLTGCSSNYNPVNWFDNDPPEADNFTPIEETNPLIPQDDGNFLTSGRDDDVGYQGTPIDRVVEVRTERIPGGLIIKAWGMANTQGIFNARLTPANDDEAPEDGVLLYRFEALNDPFQTAQGAKETREVVVARKRTDQELGNTRIIRIEGANNAVEARR